MKKYFVFDEDFSSKEEAREFEEESNKYSEWLSDGKERDDYSFDGDFNFAIEAKYYEDESCNYVFIGFESELDNIYRYYQYTKRYIAAYEKKAAQYYKDLSEETGEDIGIYNYAKGDLTHLNCESILIMVFSAFEAFLRNLISYVDDSAGILEKEASDKTTREYLEHLHFEHDLFVPKDLYWQYDQIRLVRNYYAHSLDEMQYKLRHSLNRQDPYGIVDGYRLAVNDKYVEHAFKVLGKMAKALEKAFVENYTEI